MTALWRLLTPAGRVQLARGDAKQPIEYLDPDLTVGSLLGPDGPGLDQLTKLPGYGRVHDHLVLTPLDSQPVWAAGVTFARSRQARLAESGGADFYQRVYEADRPELFIKASPGMALGSGQSITIRSDSAWNVPEPELVVILDHAGVIVAYTLGNDVSSRSIEAENPLYLPQAKIWDGSCAIGPALIPATMVADPFDLVVGLTVTRGSAEIFREQVQISAMRRTPTELADWLTRHQRFPSGVALMTGTSMVPPDDFSLQSADSVTISCHSLGALHNSVSAAGMATLTSAPFDTPIGAAITPRDLAARYWAAESERNLDAVMECFSPDAVFCTVNETHEGQSAIRRRYRQMAEEFPGLRVTMGPDITAGSNAALRWFAVLTDREGRETILRGVNLVHVRAGKFERVECYYDSAPAAASADQSLWS